MAVITESQLRSLVGYRAGTIASTSRGARIPGVQSIFLSHSSKDGDLALLVKNALEKVNVSVYVDWLDAGLPDTVSSETARILRERIKQNHLLLLLATNNALSSRWVPWELGFADGQNGEQRIAVLEVQRDNETYRGNEYVSLYQKLRLPIPSVGMGVYSSGPVPTTRLVEAKEWLQQR